MKKTFALLLSFFVFITSGKDSYGKDVKLYAKAAIVMEASTGKVLYGKSQNIKMANASTTKILTCYYIIKHCKLEDDVTISKNAASQPKVRLGVQKGETYKVKDLLYGLMLESYNDCAVALAEYAHGSVKNFASKINKEAKKMGAKKTHFVTPNGLDGVDQGGSHQTTAYDLAKIMSVCMKDTTFLEITREKTYSFSDKQKKRRFACNNHNALLHSMEGAISGKTGYTSKAGYCYVGAVNQNGMDLVVAVLASGWPPHKSYKWSDVRNLLSYATDTYEYKEIIPDVNPVKTLPLMDGLESSVKLKYPKLKEQILAKKEDNVQIKLKLPSKLNAPCKKGQVVGNISYVVGNDIVSKKEIKLGETIRKKDYWWYLGIALNRFCI